MPGRNKAICGEIITVVVVGIASSLLIMRRNSSVIPVGITAVNFTSDRPPAAVGDKNTFHNKGILILPPR